MTAKRIIELDPLTGAASANDDALLIFDVSDNTTKRIMRSQFTEAIAPELQAALNLTSGTRIYTGIGDPTGDIGEDGDLFIDSSNGNFWSRGGTTWALLSNIRGPAGLPGPDGPAGLSKNYVFQRAATQPDTPAGNNVPAGWSDFPPAGSEPLWTTHAWQDVDRITYGVWSLPIRLDGAAGATWYSGAGAPAGGLGAVGDLYLDETMGFVYRKTGASAWTLIADITGPQGPAGPELAGDFLEAVDVLPVLPDAGYPEGAIVALRTDGRLYQNQGGVWVDLIAPADLTGTVRTVAVLPVLPDAEYPIGSYVLLSTDSKLYGNEANVWVAVTGDVPITATVQMVGVLPALPDAAYPEGTVVLLSTDGYLYQNQSDAWVVISAPPDLTGAVRSVGVLPTLPDADYPVNSYVLLTTTNALYQNQANVWVEIFLTAETSAIISVAVLPVLPDAGYPLGQVVYLETTGVLYINVDNVWTVLNLTVTATGGLEIVATLPVLPDAGYPAGTVIYNQTDGLLYKNDDNATWTTVVNAAEISGQLTAAQIASVNAVAITGEITTTQITDSAISTPKLAVGAVSATRIAADAIDATKIQANAVTADKILALSVTTVKLDTNAVTADKILAGSITTVKLDTDAVTSNKIAAGAITVGKIDAGAVTAETIASNSIDTGMLRAYAVTAINIAANAVTTEKIIADSIDATKIKGDAITASKILAGSVTTTKLDAFAVTAEKIAGNAIVAGKIAADAVTVGTIAAGAVITDSLEALSITTEKIAGNAITGVKIQGNTITGNKIAGQTITATNMAANSITAANGAIADLTVTTAKIANLAVTDAKINTLAVSKLTAGTLNAGITYTNTLTLSTNGKLHTAGKTSAASTTSGIFLGHDGATSYDFAIGDATQSIIWDGSAGTLALNGQLVANGNVIDLSVGKLTTGPLNADINVGTGRIIWDNGGFIKASGVGFGTSNQFLEWFGPRPTGGNLALCSEATAIQYLKTNGDAYFGGSLSAGTLKTAVQTTSLAADASVETAQYGSNGGSIQVVLSYYAYSETQQFYDTQADWKAAITSWGGTPPAGGGELFYNSSKDIAATASIALDRSVNGGAYSLGVTTLNITGGTETLDGASIPEINNHQLTFTRTFSGPLTYTDPQTLAQDRQYRARITARAAGIMAYNSGRQQRISIISTEE